MKYRVGQLYQHATGPHVIVRISPASYYSDYDRQGIYKDGIASLILHPWGRHDMDDASYRHKHERWIPVPETDVDREPPVPRTAWERLLSDDL